ncbi:hypothetical protein ACLB2K_046722 [Fragaria x ananassa]
MQAYLQAFSGTQKISQADKLCGYTWKTFWLKARLQNLDSRRYEHAYEYNNMENYFKEIADELEEAGNDQQWKEEEHPIKTCQSMTTQY